MPKSIRPILGATLIAVLMGCSASNQDNVSGQSVKMATVSVQVVDTPTVQNQLLNLILPKAYAEVTSSIACFKRLRFKFAESADDAEADYEVNEDLEDNVDLYLGEVDLTASGNALGTIEIPEGEYRRIEVELEDKCAGGQSLSIVNSNGSYTTSDRISVRFEGTFTAEDNAVLGLNINKIIEAIDAYDGTTNLKDSIEAASGSF